MHGSLPKPVIAKIKEEHELRRHRIIFSDRPDKDILLYREQKAHFKRYDEALDKVHNGLDFLKQPCIAQLVVDKLKEFDGRYYYLLSYCVMSNHVHIVVDFSAQLHPETGALQGEYKQLYEVMHLIKGSKAFAANAILERRGISFWQKDSYDHYVRNDGELERIIKYVKHNPVKAGLVVYWEDWPYTQ